MEIKIKVWKFFFDIVQKEKWINKIAKTGWGLCDCKWGRLYFEPIEPGQYTYKILIMDNLKEKKDFIESLKAAGIECAASYRHYLYLKKESSKGTFEKCFKGRMKLQFC